MNRRKFLSYSSAVSIPLILNGFELSAYANNTISASIDDSEKVLVLIQLIGGNDGLNTLIPLDSYDNLVNVRSNVIIPENKILKINDEYGFHPAFSEMNDLHQESILHVVQGVAYPNQNPAGYPNEEYPHPFALTVGGQVAGTCQGTVSNFSMAINKPEDLLPLSESEGSQFPDNKYGRALSYVSQNLSYQNAYAEVIKEAILMQIKLIPKINVLEDMLFY